MFKLFRILVVVSFLFSISCGEVVRIGFDRMAMAGATKKDVEIATGLLMEKVLVGIDIETDIKYYEDLNKMSQDMDNGHLEYISIPPLKLIKYFNLNNIDLIKNTGA